MEQQTDPMHLLIQITKILDRLHIPYLVTGGIAVLIWGRPRFTADIDISIVLPREKVANLSQALKELGNASHIDTDDMYRALGSNTQNEFNFIDATSGIKVDFWIARSSAYEQSRFARRFPKEVLGQTVNFISPEDLMLAKLQWYQQSESSKQWEDVESIIKMSGAELDWKYLQEWAERLGLTDELAKLSMPGRPV